MKILANKLVVFLEKLSLKGKINTCVLNFTKEGIISRVTAANIIAVEGKINKDKFDDYEAIGEVGIKNNLTLINLLKRYEDKPIKIEQQDNKLVFIGETGSIFYILTDKDNVENHREDSFDLEKNFEGNFELDVDKLVNIKKSADIIKAESMLFTIKDKKLSLSVESSVGDKITEETEVDYPDMECKYGDYLMGVIDVIVGRISVYLKEKTPIFIKCGDFKYVIAPMYEESDEEE